MQIYARLRLVTSLINSINLGLIGLFNKSTNYSLDNHGKVSKVYYPGLSHHPQFERSAQLFRKPGALFSFELNQESEPFDFLNRLKVVIKSSNLGDNRTLAIPVSQTIYYEMGAARRKEMGIAESLIRISVGIEEVEDLIEDFRTALET